MDGETANRASSASEMVNTEELGAPALMRAKVSMTDDVWRNSRVGGLSSSVSEAVGSHAMLRSLLQDLGVQVQDLRSVSFQGFDSRD